MKKTTKSSARVSRTNAREALVRAINQVSDSDLANVIGGNKVPPPAVLT